MQNKTTQLRYARVIASTLLLSVLLAPFAMAQTTGKLAGVVTDASTGEPLPGANVVIVGTQLGTATDIDGSYFILGVPVGTYDIQASFVGFQAETRSSVEINAGYTRELNFSLAPGAELDEIVVEYERPLIQKDALGVPKITTAEQIANLPVRGVADVAALQAGVVKQEGSDDLFIRGGREQEVTFFVDGVKVIGSIAVPNQAIQEQEMLVGAIPAKYGDAMSGVISVSTKTGAPEMFGSIEAITSEVLDSYGYNDVQATLGGPLFSEKLQFFVSGEFAKLADPNPSAIRFPTLSSANRQLIQNSPQSVRIVNGSGESAYIPFPSDITPGSAAADVLARLQGQIPDGWSLASEFPSPIYTSNTFTSDDIEFQNQRPGDDQKNLVLNGNLQFSPLRSIRLRVGGGIDRSRGKQFSFIRSLYAPESHRNDDQDTWRVFGSWTQYLSNNTFFQLQADYSDWQGVQYHPGFSDDVRDVLFYGDIDHPANAPMRSYFEFNPDDSTYVRAQQDGEALGFRDIQNTWSPWGIDPALGFDQWHFNRLGFRANATTQIGIHQIEFGGEFEKQTQRLFSMISQSLPENLARYHNDENGPEAGSENAVDRYEDLGFGIVDEGIRYYGYNYLGTEEVDDENVDNFTNPEFTGAGKYNVAPYEPIYYAGYVQDKIEYRDLVVNLGVRVDVFDNNAMQLRDPFALFPIVRAADQGGAPSHIGDDYAVYFNTSNEVIGYRDLDGNYFDAEGQNASGSQIRTAGKPKAKVNRITSEVFEDYDPQVTFQPRIGISFPVTDQALFFASYNVISQRPSENQFDTVQQWNQAAQQSTRINNSGLEPVRTTTYELGFRQRLGARAALQISGFYKQIENLISLRIVQNVFPTNYQTFDNADFGTVKGVEFEFDLRRTNNVSLNANYTLSFAEGTGSDAQTTNQIVWRMEEDPFYPRFISPLDFDQRHRANLSLDYRLGENEGPELFGGYPLSNFGVNVVGTFGTGLPYTKRRDESPNYTAFNGFLVGEINGQSMPFSSLVNLRVDRRFTLGGSNLVVYLWVQNIFDQQNVVAVYPQTGLADDDAYLTNPQGRDYIAGLEENAGEGVANSFSDHYRLSLRAPFNYGIPRTIRAGLRYDF